MNKVGLSQRVEIIKSYNETRDALDQNWHRLAKQNSFTSIPIPNNINITEELLNNISFDGFILTGGNDLSHLPNSRNVSLERDETENYLMNYCKKNQNPLLGVCRGFQLLNSYFGGTLSRLDGHVNSNHEISVIENNFIDKQLISVNSYHNYGIKEEDLSTDLEPFAISSDGTIEAAFHRHLRWIGIMWHPERSESKIDSKIFKYLFG